MENNIVQIISNGMEGEGIAKCENKVIFVDGGVIEDQVEIEITKSQKSFSRAKITNIIKPSKHRCEPTCKYFGECGGCNLQHINYDMQLQIKTQNVQNLFDKSKLNFKVENCEPSENVLGYRNKLTFYISNNNTLSFYKEKSHNYVDIKKCLLVNEKFNHLIVLINTFLLNNKEFNKNILKSVIIRQINDCFMIHLVLAKKTILLKLVKWLNLNKINYSLSFSINDKVNSNFATYPTTFVAGVENVYSNEFDIKYPVYPMSFLQVNAQIKNVVYNEILNLLKDNQTVLDAYSGAGLLSAIIAKKCHYVYSVEIDESASKACEALCKLNNIKNLKTYLGDCGLIVPEILNSKKIHTIVLDPARKGVNQSVLDAIVNSQIEHVIYLSCNPATLARDLKVLTDNGFKITKAKPYDMFPQTNEVETLVELQK